MRESTASNKSASSKNNHLNKDNSQGNAAGGQFEVSIGQKVEVLDHCNIWRNGEVRLIDAWDKTVCVHYDGTEDFTEDEWLEVTSGRLRPLKITTKDVFKIPKTDLAKQLALASSISQDGVSDTISTDKVEPEKPAGIVKLLAKERKVPQFRKGTFVLATWIDRRFYPAVVVRVLNELSFLVEFVDGSRWALGSQCFVRTLTKTEYERLFENPEVAVDVLGSRRLLMSPPTSPREVAPPPRKRFRLASPSSSPAVQQVTKADPPPVEESSSSSRKSKGRSSVKQVVLVEPKPSPSKQRKSVPNKADAEEKHSTTKQPPTTPLDRDSSNSRRKSVPTLGGSEKSFTSKASVRSVSPLPEDTTPIVESSRATRLNRRSIRNQSSNNDADVKILNVETANNPLDKDVQIVAVEKDEDMHIVAVKQDDDLHVVETITDDEPRSTRIKRASSSRSRRSLREDATVAASPVENKTTKRRSSRRNSEVEETLSVASMVLSKIPSAKDPNVSIFDLMSRPASSLGYTAGANSTVSKADLTLTVQDTETKTKSKVRFSLKKSPVAPNSLASIVEYSVTTSNKKLLENGQVVKQSQRRSLRSTAGTSSKENVAESSKVLKERCRSAMS